MNYSMGEVIDSNCFSVISRPIPKYPGAERFQNIRGGADNRCDGNNVFSLDSASPAAAATAASRQRSNDFFCKSSWSCWPLESRLPYKVTCNMLKSNDLQSTSCDCSSDIDLIFRSSGSASKGTSGHSYRNRKKLQTADIQCHHRANAKQQIGVPTSYFECGSAAGKKCFRCPECYYVTDRKNNLKRHLGTMHQDCGKMLQCCEKMFNSKAALREHIFLLHRSGYRCSYCARSFCRKALLKRHILVHEECKNKHLKDGADVCCRYYDQGTGTLRFKKHSKFPAALTSVSLKTEVIVQNDYEPYVNEHFNAADMINCHLESDFDYDSSVGVFPTKKLNSSARMIFYDRIRSTHYDGEKDPSAERLRRQKVCKAVTQSKVKQISEHQSVCSDNRSECFEYVSESSDRFSSSGKSEELSSAAAIKVTSPRRVMKTSDVKRLCTNPYLCTKCGRDFTHQHQIIEHDKFCEKHQHSIDQALIPSV